MNELLEQQLKKIVGGYYAGLVSGGELDTALQFTASFGEAQNERNQRAILDAMELVLKRAELRIMRDHKTHDPFSPEATAMVRRCFA